MEMCCKLRTQPVVWNHLMGGDDPNPYLGGGTDGIIVGHDIKLLPVMLVICVHIVYID